MYNGFYVHVSIIHNLPFAVPSRAVFYLSLSSSLLPWTRLWMHQRTQK